MLLVRGYSKTEIYVFRTKNSGLQVFDSGWNIRYFRDLEQTKIVFFIGILVSR